MHGRKRMSGNVIRVAGSIVSILGCTSRNTECAEYRYFAELLYDCGQTTDKLYFPILVTVL